MKVDFGAIGLNNSLKVLQVFVLIKADSSLEGHQRSLYDRFVGSEEFKSRIRPKAFYSAYHDYEEGVLEGRMLTLFVLCIRRI